MCLCVSTLVAGVVSFWAFAILFAEHLQLLRSSFGPKVFILLNKQAAARHRERAKERQTARAGELNWGE